VWPTAFEWKILVLMSLAFTIGQWLFTAAMRLGDTAAVAPLNYVRLLMMAALGWVVYAEVPSLTTALGAVLIIGSATFTLRRNASRRPAAPPVEPT
jgi:drug/metabolite transporter (DMT)-like permease